MNIADYQFFKRLTQLPFVKEIWLYGSRARGDQKERSDIDLAIICPSANAAEWQQVIDIIENSDTLLKIDYVRWETLDKNEAIVKQILSDRVILYSSHSVPGKK